MSSAAESAGTSAGTRKRSLAQAPRSALRQRSLQNGRQRLLGTNGAGWLQVGQGTRRGAASAMAGRSGAEREFERGIDRGAAQPAFSIGPHEPDRDHQPVAADLGHQTAVVRNAHAHQLESLAWRQALLAPNIDRSIGKMKKKKMTSQKMMSPMLTPL